MPARHTVPGPDPAPFVQCVAADNPSDMTLSGTNTYLIGAPCSETVVVVDPGPAVTAALVRDRLDDLREQAHLAVGGRAERAQVPALDAEPGELADGLADGDVA